MGIKEKAILIGVCQMFKYANDRQKRNKSRLGYKIVNYFGM